MTLKEKFISESELISTTAKYLIAAVKLPTGATEVITNTENIQSKIEYYKNSYDEDFKLKTNGQVQIINFMIV